KYYNIVATMKQYSASTIQLPGNRCLCRRQRSKGPGAMRMSRRFPAAAMAGAAATAMTAVGFVSTPPAYAEGGDAADVIDDATRITIPGAGPLYYPNFFTEIPGLGERYLPNIIHNPDLSILQAYDLLNHEIGENWFPGS